MKVIKIVLGKKGLCVHVCARYLSYFQVVLAGHTKNLVMHFNSSSWCAMIYSNKMLNLLSITVSCKSCYKNKFL